MFDFNNTLNDSETTSFYFVRDTPMHYTWNVPVNKTMLFIEGFGIGGNGGNGYVGPTNSVRYGGGGGGGGLFFTLLFPIVFLPSLIYIFSQSNDIYISARPDLAEYSHAVIAHITSGGNGGDATSSAAGAAGAAASTPTSTYSRYARSWGAFITELPGEAAGVGRIPGASGVHVSYPSTPSGGRTMGGAGGAGGEQGSGWVAGGRINGNNFFPLIPATQPTVDEERSSSGLTFQNGMLAPCGGVGGSDAFGITLDGRGGHGGPGCGGGGAAGGYHITAGLRPSEAKSSGGPGLVLLTTW